MPAKDRARAMIATKDPQDEPGPDPAFRPFLGSPKKQAPRIAQDGRSPAGPGHKMGGFGLLAMFLHEISTESPRNRLTKCYK